MGAMPPDADRPRSVPARTSQLLGRGRDLQAQAGQRLRTAGDEHVTVKLVIDALREDRDTGGHCSPSRRSWGSPWASAAGALGGSLRDAGIGDAFIQEVRDEVTPGTSALFVTTSDGDVERVRDAFLAHHPTLLHTNLTPEQDAALREYFGA